MKTTLITAIAGVLMLGAVSAHAENGGDFVVKVGVHEIDPQSNNGKLANGTLAAKVSSEAGPTITGEYMFTPEWGFEVLAALPFQHDVKLNGAKAATVKHLPPVLSAQYHFNPGGSVSPFVGLGINYTLFLSEHTTGPLAGTKLSLDNSFGPALHGGIDFRLNERWLLTVDARWINIETDAKVNGSKVGTVKINPFVYGLAVGYRF